MIFQAFNERHNFLSKGIFLGIFGDKYRIFKKLKIMNFSLKLGKVNGLVELLNYMEPGGIYEKKKFHGKGDWAS